MVKLDSKERQRLLNLLGMMSSSHDGEAIAAARMAVQFLTQRSLTWEQVIVSATTKPSSGDVVVKFNGDEVMDMAAAYAPTSASYDMAKLLAHSISKNHFDKLNVEERIFVKHVLTSRSLTVSDRARIGDIFKRLVRER